MIKFNIFYTIILAGSILPIFSCNTQKEEVEEDKGLSELATAVRPGFLFGTSLKQDRNWDGEHDMWTKIEEFDQYEQIFLDNFNCAAIVVFHNRLQFEPGGPYLFEESGLDYRVNWAHEHGLPVYLQPLTGPNIYNPDWLVNGNYSKDQLDSILTAHLETMITKYKDKVDYLEVVNEALAYGGGWRTDNVYLNMGFNEEGDKKWPVFFEKAFRMARELASDNTQLIYNDNKNAMIESPRSDMTYEVIKLAKEQQIPIDGVGLQFHTAIKDGQLYAGAKAEANKVDFDSFSKNMQRLADLGIDIHITEFDVHLPEYPTQQDFDLQAQAYKEVVKRCIEQPACKSFKTWNFIDKYSWRAYREYNEQPQLFDTLLNPKKAYFAIEDYLKSRIKDAKVD